MPINQSSPEINGHVYPKNQALQASPYETRNPEVEEIMSRMPSWIIRQGTTVLFVVIALLFTGAYFIRYPDEVVTSVNIVSSDPPVKLVARENGRIHRFFVTDNQPVSKGQAVCLLENTAVYEDMLILKQHLSRLESGIDLQGVVSSETFPVNLHAGDLQPGYADLYQAIQQYRFFMSGNFAGQKVAQLQSQVNYQSALSAELRHREEILKQQLLLEKNRFEADSILVREKVIARLEFDNSRKELLNRQLNADAARSGILQNSLQQSEYLKTITELQQQKMQQQHDLEQNIRDQVKRLGAQWEVWKQKYLLTSPVAGKASFFNVWKENQNVASGEAVLMIVPPVQHYMAKASLPVSGAGKVRPGQQVLIRLASFPYDEFGMIRGTVKRISAVAMDTAFAVEVSLTRGLTTTINRQVPPQPELSGQAIVVTDNKSILQRLFEKIWISHRH